MLFGHLLLDGGQCLLSIRRLYHLVYQSGPLCRQQIACVLVILYRQIDAEAELNNGDVFIHSSGPDSVNTRHGLNRGRRNKAKSRLITLGRLVLILNLRESH